MTFDQNRLKFIMKEYKWKDVIEFLEENPKLRYDYSSIYECVMAKFFQEKTGVRTSVSYSGWRFKDYARIVDPPTSFVRQILLTKKGVFAKTSEEILEAIKEGGYYE